MKRVNFFVTKAVPILAFFVFIFQSCKKEIKPDAAPAADERISFLRQEVANSIGISADKVIYRHDEKIFEVDEDGIITLEDAVNRFAGNGADLPGGVNGTSQRRGYYEISRSKVNAIKIYVKKNVPSEWVNILDVAIKNWNATGSKVYMKRVTSPIGATTQVIPYYSASSIIALSAYPDHWGNPGNKIKININQKSLPYLKKVFAITHELGHTLGFSHTNGTYGNLISGTPVKDPHSIMNSYCLNWTDFSAYDYKAVRNMYPR